MGQQTAQARKVYYDEKCIFCVEESDEILQEFASLAIWEIWDTAKELEDFELLSRICWGDLVAIEGKHEIGCLTKFRNSFRSLKRKKETIPEDSLNEAMNKS